MGNTSAQNWNQDKEPFILSRWCFVSRSDPTRMHTSKSQARSSQMSTVKRIVTAIVVSSQVSKWLLICLKQAALYIVFLCIIMGCKPLKSRWVKEETSRVQSRNKRVIQGLSPTHSHTSVGSVGFSILPTETSMCGPGKLGIEPPTFWLAGDCSSSWAAAAPVRSLPYKK